MSARAPLLTVVIPCGRRRPVGLDAWRAQDLPLEILLLLNGNYTGEDLGAPLAEADSPRGEPRANGIPAPLHPPAEGWPVRSVRVEWRGHGPTRQGALPLLRTPLVCFSVDDALPLGAGVARALARGLQEGAYDAVSARQVPWGHASGAVRARLRAWTPPPQPGAPTHAPTDRLDHVAALYRTETLRGRPLPELPTAEDWAWARLGEPPPRLGYVPGAAVLHSHARAFAPLRARTREEHAVRVSLGEAPRVRGWGGLVRALPGAAMSGMLRGDLPGTLGELFGQAEGARAAAALRR